MSVRVVSLVTWSAAVSAEPWAAGDERSVVIASGTRGGGSSVVATLLALACTAESRRTLLVDGANDAGTLRRLAGEPPDETDSDANPVHTDHDIVLIDAGSRLDDVLVTAGLSASRFIVIAGVTPVSRASAYALVKAIEAHSPGAPLEILMNTQDPRRSRDAVQQMQEAAARFLDRELRLAGSIPDDPALRAAVTAGRSLAHLSGRSPAGQAAHMMAARILAELDEGGVRAAPIAARQVDANRAGRMAAPQLLERRQ